MVQFYLYLHYNIGNAHDYIIIVRCLYQVNNNQQATGDQHSDVSDFIWDFGKLPFPTHLGKYYIKIGKKRAKIHEIGKIKAIF